MSAREWKPGEIAMIPGCGPRMMTDRGWVTLAGQFVRQFADVRPLVVIDPDLIPVAKGGLAPTWLRSLARELRDDDRSISTSLENVLLYLAEQIEATVESPKLKRLAEPTVRAHPTRGGRPIVAPITWLREHYTEQVIRPGATS